MTRSDMKSERIETFDDPVKLVTALADRFVDLAKSAIKDRGQFTVALSGGSTPKALYEMLALPPYAESIDWSCVRLFLGDERCVPHGDKESNYTMAEKALLSKIALPASSIFATAGQDKDPQASAQNYEATIRQVFNAPAVVPAFDLILLGLGPDGHTASLFPGSKALAENEKLVVANFVEKFDSWRLTFTYPLINNAREIFFMVSGESKAQILNEVLNQPEKKYPSQAVNPTHGKLVWFIDKDAAKLLKTGK